ncbi:hypothetical protein AAEX28_14270 [Lentisphaerota bacterium WC36G]|nr:hypothetical protein LJT99_01025 [Lentisphaerae bacterium WC36]
MKQLRIGKSGLHGEIGNGLTPKIIIDYACAFGSLMEQKTIVVAIDNRISSEMILNSVVGALYSTGCDVINLGVCSAPVFSYAIKKLKAFGGLLIGATHHPYNWNAIQPFSEDGQVFNAMRQQELLDIYHSKRYDFVDWDKLGTNIELTTNINENYVNFILKNIDVEKIIVKQFTVVADFCNGAGAKVAKIIAEKLNLNLVSINDSVNGILPHNPEPRPRSAMQIKPLILPLNADIGFVFSSDMSRVSLVSDTAETLSEEYSFALALNYLLKKIATTNQDVVVTNLCTSKMIDHLCNKHNIKLFKTAACPADIADMSESHKAIIAGEGCGSVQFTHLKNYDSFMVMIMMLEAIALDNAPISQHVSKNLPKFHIVKRKFNISLANGYAIIKKFRDHFSNAQKITEGDGIRFDWEDGWIYLRNSLSEGAIRVIVEWKSKEIAKEKALIVYGILKEYYHAN